MGNGSDLKYYFDLFFRFFAIIEAPLDLIYLVLQFYYSIKPDGYSNLINIIII
jgi:hypothetical protein